MPGARGHDIITILTGVAMIPPSYVALAAADPVLAPLQVGILFGAHIISGMLFSPDLDLDSAIDDRWGMFGWIWWPYRQCIPHRHFWSHGLILPPLVRLVYVLVPLLILTLVLARFFAGLGIVVHNYHERVLAAIVGLIHEHPTELWMGALGFVTGGAAHTIADWCVTGGKHYLSRLGFRSARSYHNHDQAIHRRRAW
jgi:uncharacterized metal-binding protein